MFHTFAWFIGKCCMPYGRKAGIATTAVAGKPGDIIVSVVFCRHLAHRVVTGITSPSKYSARLSLETEMLRSNLWQG